MNKLTTIIVSASVGLVIGMTGMSGVSAKTHGLSGGKSYSQSQMYKCAGAVMEADAIINGGDKSLKKSFNKKRNACSKVVGGF